MAVKGAFSWWVACRRYFVLVLLICWSFSLSFSISYTLCWSSLFAQAISSVLSRIFVSRLILYSSSSSVMRCCVSMKWNIILLAAELIIFRGKLMPAQVPEDLFLSRNFENQVQFRVCQDRQDVAPDTGIYSVLSGENHPFGFLVGVAYMLDAYAGYLYQVFQQGFAA